MYGVQLLFMTSIFLLNRSVIYGNYSCWPIEENHKFVFNLTFPSNDSYIFKNDVRVITKCNSEVTDKINVSCIHNKNSSQLWNVELVNVTRDYEGTWTFVNGNDPILTCNVIVYTKPKKMKCSFSNVSSGIEIFCSPEKVYPAALCLASLPSEQYNVTYHHTEYTRDKFLYYKSICNVFIPSINGYNGTKNILITMYPNITDDITDEQYGVIGTQWLLK